MQAAEVPAGMGARRMFEVCAETLQACVAAGDGGADRIELCSALSLGGVTPSLGLVRQAVAHSTIPIHVLLRPRGGDFVYSDDEFAVICNDLENAREAGAAGVVVGMLGEDGLPDARRMRRIVDLAGSLEVTFHRAFDRTADLPASLETVIDTGCQRLLTSGGAPSALQGIRALARLCERADGRVRIAAGGGVNLQTVKAIMDAAPVDLHASLRPAAPLLAAGDPLWDDSAAPAHLSAQSVRDLAQLVRRHPYTISL